MKKLILLALAAITALSLVACAPSPEAVVEEVVTTMATALTDNAQEGQAYEVTNDGSKIVVKCTLEQVDSNEVDMEALNEAILPTLQAAETAYVDFVNDMVKAGVKDAAIAIDYYTVDGEWIGGTLVE